MGEAADGASALEQLAEGTYDVVLTDLRMPTLDGMELLQAVQRSSPQTQVIVMTAYGTIETRGGGHPARRLRLPHQAVPVGRAAGPGGQGAWSGGACWAR